MSASLSLQSCMFSLTAAQATVPAHKPTPAACDTGYQREGCTALPEACSGSVPRGAQRQQPAQLHAHGALLLRLRRVAVPARQPLRHGPRAAMGARQGSFSLLACSLHTPTCGGTDWLWWAIWVLHSLCSVNRCQAALATITTSLAAACKALRCRSHADAHQLFLEAAELHGGHGLYVQQLGKSFLLRARRHSAAAAVNQDLDQVRHVSQQ